MVSLSVDLMWGESWKVVGCHRCGWMDVNITVC
jgi:hypothetical protein